MADNILKKNLEVTYEDFLGRSNGEIHGRAIASVIGETGGRGWVVEDRGMDDARHLRVHSGDRAAEVRWREGVLQYCAPPRRRDAVVENVRGLVVESRFDGKSLWLYVVCSDAELDDPAKTRANALRAAAFQPMVAPSPFHQRD